MAEIHGSHYNPSTDKKPLASQMERVRVALNAGGWKTVDEIQGYIKMFYDAHDPATSISAQIRNLRKEKNGGYKIITRARAGHNRLYEFCIKPRNTLF